MKKDTISLLRDLMEKWEVQVDQLIQADADQSVIDLVYKCIGDAEDLIEELSKLGGVK